MQTATANLVSLRALSKMEEFRRAFEQANKPLLMTQRRNIKLGLA